ncbi:MAG: HWE histidine kinase domain-containing protein [Pseudorhodoplanes sp.]
MSVNRQISEAQRLALLNEYEILDSDPEPAFDDIVMLARELCDTPIALISLVAESRQWFKAASGVGICETPISQSVCSVAIHQHETFVVPDLTRDERTRHNTLVTGDPFLRFYAGALLRTATGINLGTLCVIDTKARPQGLTRQQQASLEALARQVMLLMELRRARQADKEALEGQHERTNALSARAADTERLNEILRVNEARLRLAQEAGQIGSFEIDTASNKMTVTEQLCRVFGVKYRHEIDASEIEQLVYPGDETLISSAEQRASGELPLQSEYRIRNPATGAIVWISRRARLMRDAFGKPVRLLGTVQDVTERKAGEERQRLLSEELSHRLKNSLALVQAIARQTLRGASDKSAVRAFDQRVSALSRAHDVLLQQDWQAADMRAVMHGVLSLNGDISRFVFEGPAVMLGAKAALSLALLMHELATNAMKYGSLSDLSGSVAITWLVEGETLVLQWKEIGGPPVEEPTRSGLGSRLIGMGLQGTNMATTRFEKSGLFAEFRAPLSLIQTPRD